MTEQDEHLRSIALPIGRSFGFDDVNALFKKKKEFQFAWRIKNNCIEIYISDYLQDAPDAVLYDLIETIFTHVKGKRPVFSKEYMDWVTSDDFINKQRAIYLKRSKNLTRSHVGNVRDLVDSAQRLLDSGLVHPSDIDNSMFTWTSRPNYRRVGYCSPMMRVVAISSALDCNNVPENVLDFVVYHEILHLRQGYRPFVRSHDREFRSQERSFPGYEEAEAFLKKLKDIS